MAQIFGPPAEIKIPELTPQNVDAWKQIEDAYIVSLQAFLKNNNYTGRNAGEVIRFAVADGYALYMVVSMKTLTLVHIPLGDAYQFQYAHLLDAEEVQKKIDQEKAIGRLFP